MTRCFLLRSWSRLLSIPVLLLAALTLPLHAVAETVWWEAESAVAGSNSMPVLDEDASVISGGKWLQGKVTDGLHAEYDVTVADGGRYTFLARRLWLHGAFRWRWDDGEWVVVQGLKQEILDQEKTRTGPACWVDLGYVTLTPGAHKLRIELVPDSTYKFNSIYGFDCFTLSNGNFAPKGIAREGGPCPEKIQIDEKSFGRNLQRTMALLESSGPDNHTPVNILCYGQSIVANSNIHLALGKYLREKYPHARISITNTAIGGYQAPILRRTAWQDLYPKNPDLIVFHVYGGETGELEEIFRTIRETMTADVLLWTHHVDNYGSGIDKQRDESSVVIRSLAAKYAFEMADVRVLWKENLRETHLDASAFLVDQIHLNTRGTELLKQCLVPHFRVFTDASSSPSDNGQPIKDQRVRIVSIPEAPTAARPLRLEFTGNRVDLVGLNGPGSAKVLLDGKVPSSQRDTLAAGRSTIAPGAWWPVITKVDLTEATVPEKYTLNFHDIAPDGSTFAFNATGSVSGDDGAGKSGEDFVSKSGRVRIKAEDIALSTVKKVTGKSLPATISVEFEIYSMSRDTVRAQPAAKGDITAIRCWKDGAHVLEIIPQGDGDISLRHATIFSPSGKAR